MSTNEKMEKKPDVTNEGMEAEACKDGKLVYTKPAKEHKLLNKVKNAGVRTWEWIKANPIKALGIGVLVTGACYGGKELYEAGHRAGFADGAASVVVIPAEETPAIEATTEEPTEEMEEETEEVVG